MNEKEVAEIRRRFRPEKNNITRLMGCYVNEKGEIVSTLQQPFSVTPQEETENILSVLKRTLSGTLGKNLLGISFETKQVVDSEEHRLLMALRDTALNDEALLQTFYERVAGSVRLEGDYIILLVFDTYDIPFRSKDGDAQPDASSEVYSYVLCSICPVKMTKPVLSYHVPENVFQNRDVDWVVAPPELGFLFPAFDDRSTNIYEALYYSRSTEEVQEEFIDTLFRRPAPMPAAAQKETFQSILGGTLAADCSYEIVEAVHGQICEMVEEHKANKEVEPLTISKGTVKRVLASCGVSDERVEAFEERYNDEFGEEVQLCPKNIVDGKQFEVRTPDVTIRVNPERRDLVETRVIDGAKYILIRADEGVEVNGISIHIS